MQEDSSARYQRVENNSWRLFWAKVSKCPVCYTLAALY